MQTFCITLTDLFSLQITGSLLPLANINRGFSNMPQQNTKYGSTGIQGNIYQLKLLMMFLYRGVIKDYSFRIGPEIKEAEKFDDLVFQYEKDGQKFYRLLQAKHRLDEGAKITTKMLLTEKDSDFSLIKYFFSYQSSKENNFFRGSCIENVILYTNIGFNSKDLSRNDIKIKELGDPDPILDTNLRGIVADKKKPRRYKFEQNMVDLLMQKIKSYYPKKLANHLAFFVLRHKMITPEGDVFSKFRKALCAEVIDVKNKQFFDTFLEDDEKLSASAKEFRRYFEDEIKTQSENKLNLANLNEKLKSAKIKHDTQIGLSVIKKFYIECSKNDWPNFDSTETDVSDFLDHLIFAVDQPNEDELGKTLMKEIGSQFDETTTRQIYQELLQSMLDFLMGKDRKERFYTWQEGIKLINGVRCEIISKLMSHFKDQLNDVPYTFERSEKLQEFISSSKNLWLLPTETPWLCSLVLQKSFETEFTAAGLLLHFHNIKWIDLLDSKGKFLSYFKDLDNFLIIITCLKLTTIKELMWGIVDLINDIIFAENGQNKKIIVIASNNHEFMKQLEIKYLCNVKCKKEDLVIDFIHLKSKTELLDKEAICFRGNSRKKSITQLLCIEGQTLSDHQAALLNLDASALEILLRYTDIQIWDESKQNSDINSEIFKADKLIKYEDLKIATEMSKNDIFGFLGGEEDIKLMILSLKVKLKSVDEIEPPFCRNRFILLNTNKQFKEFNYLCHLAKNCSCGRADHVIHEIKIVGNQCIWLQTYSQHFYIPRFFNPLFTPKEMKGMLVKGYFPTFVVFSGLKKITLMSLLQINSRTDRQNFKQNCVVKISGRCASNVFNAIKRMMELNEVYEPNVPYLTIRPLITKKGVAWIHILENNGSPYFEWIQSAGDCSTLLQTEANTPEGYVAEFKQRYLTFPTSSRKSSHLMYNYSNMSSHTVDTYRSYLSETFFMRLKRRLVVIADEPGMGKSTTFMHLVNILEEQKQLSIAVNINLSKHQDLFISEPFTKQSLIESLICIFPNSKHKPLMRRILAYKLKFRYQVVLLCDGFDEMSSENQESVLRWIKFVVEDTEASVWITTRLSHKETLENGLSVLAYSFESLVQEEIEDYLSKFWKTTLMFHGKNSHDFNFKKVAEKVAYYFNPVFGMNYNHSFIMFPFMLRILAEKYIEVSKEVLIDNINDEKLLETKTRDIKAWDVYNAFVHQKYEMYFNSLGINGRLDEYSELILRNCYSFAYRRLAAEKMHEESANIYCNNEIRNHLSTHILWKIGLVQKYSNNQVSFIHPSLGEYFAFEFICNALETSSSSFLFWDFLLNGVLVHSFCSRLFDDKLKSNSEFSHLLDTREIKNIVYEILLNQVNTPFRPVALWNAANDKLKATVKFLLKSVQSRSKLEMLLGIYTNISMEITNENIERFVQMCLVLGTQLVTTRMARHMII